MTIYCHLSSGIDDSLLWNTSILSNRIIELNNKTSQNVFSKVSEISGDNRRGLGVCWDILNLTFLRQILLYWSVGPAIIPQDRYLVNCGIYRLLGFSLGHWYRFLSSFRTVPNESCLELLNRPIQERYYFSTLRQDEYVFLLRNALPASYINILSNLLSTL